MPSAASVSEPYAPVCEPALKASAGLSASEAVSWPPVVGEVSSVTAPMPVEMTGASSVPVTVTVTVVVEPSLSVTVNLSVTIWPPVSACAAGPSV